MQSPRDYFLRPEIWKTIERVYVPYLMALYRAGHSQRLLLPSLLVLNSGRAVLLAIALSQTGCYFIIPCDEGRWATHNKFEGVVGPADSHAAVRVEVSDRAEVRSALGEPWNNHEARTDPRKAWRYADYTRKGTLVWMWPLVHGGCIQPTFRTHNLAIWFGADGLVKRYEMWGDEYNPSIDADEATSRPTTVP